MVDLVGNQARLVWIMVGHRGYLWCGSRWLTGEVRAGGLPASMVTTRRYLVVLNRWLTYWMFHLVIRLLINGPRRRSFCCKPYIKPFLHEACMS